MKWMSVMLASTFFVELLHCDPVLLGQLSLEPASSIANRWLMFYHGSLVLSGL